MKNAKRKMDGAHVGSGAAARPRRQIAFRGVPIRLVATLLVVIILMAVALVLVLHSASSEGESSSHPVIRGVLDQASASLLKRVTGERPSSPSRISGGRTSAFMALTERSGTRGGAAPDAAPGVCAGVAERALPTCVAMPQESELRIAIAALPPEAYTRKAPREAAAPGAPGDPAWLDAAYQAAWDFATGKYEEWVDLDLERAPPTLAQIRDSLMSIDVPDDVVRPPPDRSAPILRTERLKQAVALTRARFARTASMQSAFTFTSQSQRDLERIVIAHLLVSPYARMVDLRSTTLAELRAFDLVFVPFPLIAMRDNPKMADRFQDLMARYVPTLTIEPERHTFIFGRLFRDTMLLPSFRKSFRPLIQVPPFNRARYMTTQPYEGEGTHPRDRAIITLPYPSVARASATGWEDPDEIDTRNLPWSTVTPASLGQPLSPCEPLCAGDEAFSRLRESAAAKGGRAPPAACRLSDAMEAVLATRPILVAFLGEPRDKQPERVAALKQLRACDQCAVFDLSAEGLSGGGDAEAREGGGGVAYGMAWVYSMSVFCVHPHGDAPPRKAFFDGISLGCIPVVLAKDDPDVKARIRAPLLPFQPLLPYDDFVVTLTKAQWFTGLVPALKAITPAKIRAMQQAISRFGHLVTWAWPPGVLDVTRARQAARKRGQHQEDADGGGRRRAESEPADAEEDGADGAAEDAPAGDAEPDAPLSAEARRKRPYQRCALDAADMLMAYLASEARRGPVSPPGRRGAKGGG